MKEKFSIYFKDPIPGPGGQMDKGSTQVLECEATQYIWVCKDVPAIREEAFITTINDYVTKIDFELSRVAYPNQPINDVSSTWQKISSQLLDNSRFGDNLNKGFLFKESGLDVAVTGMSDEQKMQIIVRYIRKNMKWDGSSSIYSLGPIKKGWEKRTGNCADINLLLIATLKEAGIKTYPVVLSTRTHGRILESAPMESKFNYVVALAEVNNKNYLLDATESFSLGALPFRCLNGKGLVVDKPARLIDLVPSEKEADIYEATTNIDRNGAISTTIQTTRVGYSAVSYRKGIYSATKEKFAESLKSKFIDYEVDNFEVLNLDSIHQPLKYRFTLSADAGNAGTVFLNTVIIPLITENPLKLQERLYPVDYGTTREYLYLSTINIPENYTVEELPKSAMFELPDKAGNFSYSVSQLGNKISIATKFNIKKPVFYSPEYKNLQEFYNIILGKHNEKIVLKKK
jgi:hypothetical protein